MTDPEWLEPMLVSSLQLLAAEAEEQLAALPDGVHKPDELVLTFGEAYMSVSQRRNSGSLVDDCRALDGCEVL